MNKNIKIGAAVLAGAFIGAAAAVFAESKTGKKAAQIAKTRLIYVIHEAIRELRKANKKKFSAEEYGRLMSSITRKYALLRKLSTRERAELEKQLSKYWHYITASMK